MKDLIADVDKTKIKWTRRGIGGAVVEAKGTSPDGANKVDVLMAMRIAECPNMPRFKSFVSGGSFTLTYFND